MRLATAALVLFVALGARAQNAPPLLTHQGRLLEGNDQPVSGAVSMRFKLHKLAAPDSNLNDPTWWESAEVTVQVSNGVYSVLLGHPSSGTGPLPTDAFAEEGERWLGVTIEGTPLLPRQRIGSAPFAFHANHAARADVALDVACATEGCVGATELALGAVTTAHLAGDLDGAKLANGSIAFDKLEPLTAPHKVTNLEADLLDGKEAAAFAAATHTHAPTEITGAGTIPLGALPAHTHSAAEIASGKIAPEFLDLPDLSSTYVARTGDSTIAGSLTVTGSTAIKLKTETSTEFDCTGKDGYVFFDASLTGFFGCASGRVYRLLARESGVGLTRAKAGLDCRDILERMGVAASGTYWIDPNGATNGTNDAFEVYCDMQTHGGGWTRCLAARHLGTGQKPVGWTKNTWLSTQWKTTDSFVLDNSPTSGNLGFFCSDLVSRASEIWGETTYSSAAIGIAMQTQPVPLPPGFFAASGAMRTTGTGNNALTRDSATQGYYNASCQTAYTSNTQQGMTSLCMSNNTHFQAQHTGWASGTYNGCPDSSTQPCFCTQSNYCGGSNVEERNTTMVLYVR